MSGANWTEDQWAEFQARLKEQPAGVRTEAKPTADVSEAFIESEVTKLLEEDGWRALRTDPVSDRGRGKGFGEIGMADHLYIRYQFAPSTWECLVPPAAWPLAPSEVLWIEFKRSGEKPKKHQTAWHTRERARGALTLIAGEDFPATVAGFRAWYDASGLRRARVW